MATTIWPTTTASDITGALNKATSFSQPVGATSSNNKSTVAGPTAGIVAADQVFFTPQLAAVTISGTVTLNYWGSESNMAANAGPEVKVERCNSAGVVLSTVLDSERGVEYAVNSLNSLVNNWTGTPTSTSLSDGDRLKFTFLHNDAGGTMASGNNLLFTYNGATGGAEGDTYVQFTETITIYAPPQPPVGIFVSALQNNRGLKVGVSPARGSFY